MKRDTARLLEGPFDLAIVGGGVYGAWTAYLAARYGLKTAVIEASDWASGTSSSSSKLIHGGLRYLEQFRFGLVRRSLNERKVLSRSAQHRLQPLRFVIPTYRGDRVGRRRLRAGLLLYDVVGGFDQPVDRHRYISPGEATSRYPFLARDGLEGAFIYGDFVTDDARFTLEVVDGAIAEGASAANYVAAERLLVEAGRVVGIAARDRIDGGELAIRARVVVNAGGPWAPTIMEGAAAPGPTRLVKGIHLVMPRLPTRDAFLVFARRNRRVVFLIPWYGRTLLGTTDAYYEGDPSNVEVDAEGVDYLLEEANRVLPEVGWNRDSIIAAFAGVRALREEDVRSTRSSPTPESLSREWSLESPRRGLLVYTGGKFTTARVEAAGIVRKATAMLGDRGSTPRLSRLQPLPWQPGGDGGDWRSPAVNGCVAAGLDVESAQTVANRYGSRLESVLALAREDGGLARRIAPDLPFVRAEVVHAAANEMVVRLEDLVRRRIPLVILTPPDRRLLEETARLASKALGWTRERCAAEVEDVFEKWRPIA